MTSKSLYDRIEHAFARCFLSTRLAEPSDALKPRPRHLEALKAEPPQTKTAGQRNLSDQADPDV